MARQRKYAVGTARENYKALMLTPEVVTLIDQVEEIVRLRVGAEIELPRTKCVEIALRHYIDFHTAEDNGEQDRLERSVTT